MKKFVIIILLINSLGVMSQGLKTQGKIIVNSNGEEVILRGVGLGGWMLMEGYMMQSSDVADTQHEFRKSLIDLIGLEKTNQFFQSWLDNHVVKADIDSLASWGFNSIRLPMHYNLFTLPIEDEPVSGTQTWLETGFNMTDNLLDWCKSNNIYLILDLHAAPGGQGENAAISDYDPTKPSLWESQGNKDKTVALWRKLADRYKDEPWIGGYDLLNEVNWTLPGNTALRSLYVEITEAIRSVDTNHIIFIEGNSFANDFTGLTPTWDNNMVYSFHKYWSYNDPGSIQWVLDIREEHNVPLWMGEAGENSNVWFTDAIKLFEDKGIGWSWWPMKRIETIVGPYSIKFTSGYKKVLNYWRNGVTNPTEDEAFAAMMELATNTNSANCDYQKDVHDAQIRQVKTNDTKPYSNHNIPGVLFMSDFDLGRNGYAYYDTDEGNYSLSTGEFQAWNSGWNYRNDAVDIESNFDNTNSNGFHVGFVDKGEWINYTVNITKPGVYKLRARIASEQTGGEFHLSVDGVAVTTTQSVTSSGSWTGFQNNDFEGVILPEGQHVLTFHIDNEGEFNISSIEFIRIGEVGSVAFAVLNGETGSDERSVEISVNKAISSASLSGSLGDFTVKINGLDRTVTEIKNDDRQKVIILTIDNYLLLSDEIIVSYNGTSIDSDLNDKLASFNNLEIRNTLPARFAVPGKIEMEAYEFMVGLQTESTTDTGGGLNIGFTDIGDYADYLISIEVEGTYQFDFRLAAQFASGKIGLYLVDENDTETEVLTVSTPITGGWQTWETKSEQASLPAGLHKLRMRILSPGFNANWFEISSFVLDVEESIEHRTVVYPNPTTGLIRIVTSEFDRFEVISLSGAILISGTIPISRSIELSKLDSGLYLLRTTNTLKGNFSQYKIIIDK
jgi:hypothetical protein